MAFERVYHNSQKQGLKRILPRVSSHGRSWVYATWDKVMAAAFLGTLGGDYTCAVGRDTVTGNPFVCERFQGAFDLRYGHVAGSIYVLPGETFRAGCTQWQEEVVSSEAVTPVQEIRVGNAKAYLLQLVAEGSLMLAFYPEKVAGIPDDDEDLVYRAVLWHKLHGDTVLESLKRYHPQLLNRVLRAIQKGGNDE